MTLAAVDLVFEDFELVVRFGSITTMELKPVTSST